MKKNHQRQVNDQGVSQVREETGQSVMILSAMRREQSDHGKGNRALKPTPSTVLQSTPQYQLEKIALMMMRRMKKIQRSLKKRQVKEWKSRRKFVKEAKNSSRALRTNM